MANKKDTVAIDADIVVFRSGFACENHTYDLMKDDKAIIVDGDKRAFNTILKSMSWAYDHHEENPWWIKRHTEVEPVENALHIAKNTIECIQNYSNLTPLVCLSGKTNARKEKITKFSYKGNRDAAHRPVHEAAIREYLLSNYPSVIPLDGKEADDVIGQLGTQGALMASIDKDLLMVPGSHYNWVKDQSVTVETHEACRTQILQLLTGDSTDNIPGIPGVGPVKAAKLYEESLTEEADFHGYSPIDLVRNQYQTAYGDEWVDWFKDIFFAITIEGAPLSLKDFLKEDEL